MAVQDVAPALVAEHNADIVQKPKRVGHKEASAIRHLGDAFQNGALVGQKIVKASYLKLGQSGFTA
jgi:hypothetical protein